MDPDHSGLLTIGRFAELSGLTPKTLRYYDGLGLLHPAAHHPETGYRYYEPGQVREAELIRLLRDLDVSLHEILDLLAHPGEGAVRQALCRQREQMAARRAEADRVIARVDRALRNEGGLLRHAVHVVTLEPTPVVSRKGSGRWDDLDALVTRLSEEAEAAAREPDVRADEREIVLYQHALLYGSAASVEVCVPLTQWGARSAAGAWELAGGPAARVVHTGPWDDIRSAYVALFAWVVEHGRESEAPVREVCLVDGRDVDDPEEYVTSLTWPLQGR
jgi:DNA-binding transcriptional MerR regulator